MKPREAIEWMEAAAWLDQEPQAPAVLRRVVKERVGKAMRMARPAKPAIRFPRGKKLVTIPKLKKEMDRVFSLFIRQRDAARNMYGMANCSTCGYFARWQDMDAGHYVPRQDMATRWDERNCHIQCKSCNGFRGGEPEKMATYINEKYGYDAARILREHAKGPTKHTRQWLEGKIAHYKAQIGESASPPKAAP